MGSAVEGQKGSEDSTFICKKFKYSFLSNAELNETVALWIENDLERGEKIDILDAIAKSELSCGQASGARSVRDLLSRVNRIADNCGYAIRLRQNALKNTCQPDAYW